MKTNRPNPSVNRTTLALLALAVLGLFQGCDHKSRGPADGAAHKKLRLAFVANTPDDFWSVVRLGCDMASREVGGADLDFRFPTKPTVEAQEELVSSLVADGVDGLALSPIDAESQTDFLNRIAAQTLLVCMDSDAAKSKRACYIGTDNIAAGKKAAELLKAALPKGGKIVLFASYLNAQNIKDRIQGLQAGLAGSNLQIADTLVDAAKSEVAQKNAQDALLKYPDLAGMQCLNGYQGPAILTAVRGAGKGGQVKLVGFDDSTETLEGIAAGDIYGTVVQMPNNLGYQTISRLAKYLNGDKTQLSESPILLPSRALTKDNVGEFQASRKTLLLKLKDGQK